MSQPSGLRTADELLHELNSVDESTRIEAKTGSEIGKSIMETVSAFANEPGLGGGYLLLGVRRVQASLFAAEYEVVGVSEPDKLQSDLASRCANDLNVPVRPHIKVERIGDAAVIVAFISESAPADKPVYIKSRSLPSGAFRRIGPTDQACSDDDLITLYSGRDQETFDASLVSDGHLSDLSAEAIRDYRQLREKANPDAEELAWADDDFLLAIGAVRRADGVLRPTVAGVLLFGTSMALRRCFPMMRIDYIRVPGREWVAHPDNRFDTLEIRAPLLSAVRRAMSAVTDDLLKSFSLSEDEVQSTEELQLPARVLREAIVNAVMHRSYRIHGSIQIIRYANRLEIRNPGHSLKSEDALGQPGSETRNPKIAAVLHEVNFAETKGSGIRVMRELMKRHDLMPPSFESTRDPDAFTAILLLHNLIGQSDLEWASGLTAEGLSQDEVLALVFVREVGAIDNATYRNINGTDTLTASARLRRLRELGLLEMKGKGSRTYYVLSPDFVRAIPSGVDQGGTSHRGVGQEGSGESVRPSQEGRGSPDPHQSTQDPHQQQADPHQSALDPHQQRADPHQSAPDPHQGKQSNKPVLSHALGQSAESGQVDEGLPPSLRERLPKAGSRPRQAGLRQLIHDLCTWRPLSATELAGLLGDRDRKVLVRSHLTPLVEEGVLEYTIPNMERHPQQRYQAAGGGKLE